MHPRMQAAGHRLVTPTCTGLGEREHLANPSIDLETHIQDILNVIRFEDLRDIVLIGHSYGGMVASGVADRARDRIAQLIYLDAFVPKEDRACSTCCRNRNGNGCCNLPNPAMAGVCHRTRRRRIRHQPISNG
ncbi:alpha/beta hydrolase [Bradyrhizobium sp.]|uniref:alpha/beta fold hydrolase n=1 Tax=Bradyrhizobium sp. TaxID=376 RepID=UPI003447792A